MKKKYWIVLVLVCIIASLMVRGVNFNSKKGENLTKNLKEHIIPIKTTKAENGFDDLMPLKSILKDKKIIGMGEATHGTADFFEMKHRMFEFLVKELDFKVLVLEAQFGDMQLVNDYIVHGIGSLEDCKSVLYTVNTSSKEILDMIEWMKAYNEDKEEAEKVKLYGYDLQLWTGNINQINVYLKKVNSRISEDLNALMKRMVQDKKLDKRLQLIEAFLPRLEEDLLANEADYVQLSSKKEFDLMLQNIACIKWHIDFTKTEGRANQYTLRDQYSAEMIQWIQNHEKGSKILISAHDMHISNALPNNQVVSTKGIPMGENLKKFFKDDYYSIGFDFFQGNFVAINSMGEYTLFDLKSSPKGSLSYELMKTGIDVGFMDIGSAQVEDTLKAFFNTPYSRNWIGAEYKGAVNLYWSILSETVDGLIYVKKTSGANYEGKELVNGNRYFVLRGIKKLLIIAVLFGVLVRGFLKRLPKAFKDETVMAFNKESKVSAHLQALGNYVQRMPLGRYVAFMLLALSFLPILNGVLNPNPIFSLGYFDLDLVTLLLSLGLDVVIFFFSLILMIVLSVKGFKKSNPSGPFLFNHFLWTCSGVLAIYLVVMSFLPGMDIGAMLVFGMVSAIKVLLLTYTYLLFINTVDKPFLKVLFMGGLQSLFMLNVEVLLFIIKNAVRYMGA